MRLVVIIAALMAFGLGLVTEAEPAAAQTWKPRKKKTADRARKKSSRKARSRAKARQRKTSKSRSASRSKAERSRRAKRASAKRRQAAPAAQPADDDWEVGWADDDNTDTIREDDTAGDDEGPAPTPTPAPAPTSSGDDWGDDGDWGDDDNDGDSSDGAASAKPTANGTTVRLDDDGLADVGPDATITDADLVTDAASQGNGSTRLETKALAFARSSVDMVHDGVPPAEPMSGIAPQGEDTIAFRVHGVAEGTGRFGRKIKVKVAGRFDADLSLDSNTNVGTQRYEAHVWDTYVDLYGRWIDVRFGNQFVAWGTADLLSPNDVVNARDLRRGFLARPEDLRIPTLALSATAYDGPFSIQALWVPVAPTNRFDLLDGDYALLGPNGPTSVERRVGAIVSSLADDPRFGPALSPITGLGDETDNGVETGELGASLAFRFRKVDLFGYFFWGHDRNPTTEFADGIVELLLTTDENNPLTADALAQRVGELGAMGVPALRTSYPRNLHAGAAIAGRIEPLGIKLDFGFDPGATTVLVPPGLGPMFGVASEHDRYGATVSVDYDRGTEMSVIVEVAHTRLIGVPADREAFQFDGDQLTVVATNFSWAPRNGPVSLRFLGFVEARDPLGYALRPAIRLSGHDNLSIEAAAVIYGGPASSLGGIQDRNDAIELTVHYGL